MLDILHIGIVYLYLLLSMQILGELAVKNQVEAWTLPLGSISRMYRAQATHSPGHITTIGLGTYIDPYLWRPIFTIDTPSLHQYS